MARFGGWSLPSKPADFCLVRSAWSDLLIVRPHSEHFHGLGVGENLVDQAVLNADAPRIRAGQVADELSEGGRRLVGVLAEHRQQELSLVLQAGCGQLPSVLLGLLRVDGASSVSPLRLGGMEAVRVVVNDLMQQGYVYYRTEPIGGKFDPEFLPELSPSQMLALGVFGGKYMTDCRDEFPAEWFATAKLSPTQRDPAVNFFGVEASKSLAYWRAKGWIHPEDPRGWFQWYCRYHMGRRCPDDTRQIRRWKAMSRHVAQLRKHCLPGDVGCRSRQRQALLQWAYDSRCI